MTYCATAQMWSHLADVRRIEWMPAPWYASHADQDPASSSFGDEWSEMGMRLPCGHEVRVSTHQDDRQLRRNYDRALARHRCEWSVQGGTR